MTQDIVQKSIEANIEVHSKLASQYQTDEPHFRPENVAKVERRFAEIARETGAKRLLDLGCGTGFMIQIAKPYVEHVTGVDVTPAMLAEVDTSGETEIELIEHDTGTVEIEEGSYQMVTAYSFLHHLAELGPTMRTASKALASGGRFYADLDPNFYFWNSIDQLERGGDYHPLVQREVESTIHKDEEIQEKFGVSAETFNLAEYGKDMAGGFREEDLRAQLLDAGFSSVEFHYEWFLGEGFLINSEAASRDELLTQAAQVNEVLQRALPVSRNMFKYLGFVATK